MKYWILQDGRPTQVELEEWAQWFTDPANRTIRATSFSLPSDIGVTVTTLFRGTTESLYLTRIDSNDDRLDDWKRGAEMLDEAIGHHSSACQLVRSLGGIPEDHVSGRPR